MERKFYWATGILSILIFAASFFTPGRSDDRGVLPWNIEHPTPGATRVFSLSLGLSTTNDAEQRFREEATPSLFKSPGGQLAAEMFFEQVTLAGLKAKIVATIAVPETELQAMYERGLRMSGTGNGKKITLAPADVTRLRALPIAGLTYMPSVRLSEETITRRFGQPTQRIKENKSAVVHWLYPQNGLDIAVGNEEKPVLQYVPPKDFGKLVSPLLNSGEIVK